MNKKPNAKRALMLSVLCLLLCISMLVGSTFAWFTDTATTQVNTIQSGELKIKLVNADGADMTEKSLSFVKAEEAPDGEKVLFEPGARYKLEAVYLMNAGNLAADYTIAVTGLTSGDADKPNLNDVIEWTITDGAGNDITKGGTLLPSDTVKVELNIEGHMLESAGNDYQGLTLTGAAITVFATQAEHEYDSYNNTYDAGAVLPDLNKSTIADKDVEIQDVFDEDYVNLFLDGNTMNQTKTTTVNEGDFTLMSGTVANNGTDKYLDVRPGEGQKVTATYEGISFVNTYKSKTYGPATNRFTNMIKVTPKNGESEFLFKNCTFDNAKIEINGLSDYAGKVKVTFENCTFKGMGTGPIIDLKNYLDIDVTITGCTFDIQATGHFEVISGMASSDITVIANNNKLNGTAAVATTDLALNGTVDQIKVNNPAVKFFGSNLDSVSEEGNTYTGIATKN